MVVEITEHHIGHGYEETHRQLPLGEQHQKQNHVQNGGEFRDIAAQQDFPEIPEIIPLIVPVPLAQPGLVDVNEVVGVPVGLQFFGIVPGAQIIAQDAVFPLLFPIGLQLVVDVEIVPGGHIGLQEKRQQYRQQQPPAYAEHVNQRAHPRDQSGKAGVDIHGP